MGGGVNGRGEHTWLGSNHRGRGEALEEEGGIRKNCTAPGSGDWRREGRGIPSDTSNVGVSGH